MSERERGRERGERGERGRVIVTERERDSKSKLALKKQIITVKPIRLTDREYV